MNVWRRLTLTQRPPFLRFPYGCVSSRRFDLAQSAFRIETASGRVFEVPHRDFVSFSPKRTSLAVFFEEKGEEHFAIIPLLTVTAAMIKT